MDNNKPPKTHPERPDTPLGQHSTDRQPEHEKPVPDGEAIAEVGDAVGGPA